MVSQRSLNASAGTLRDLASLQLEATGLSLDASSAADLAATFDGRQIEIDEASRFVFPCVAECVGYHTFQHAG